MIELTKTLNFSKKLRCFGVCISFSEKSSKKCFISWRNTKNLSFGQNFQPFEQSTTFRRLHEFFSKKLQKVPHFVIKLENSSISQKFSTFRANYHVSAFWRTFQKKVAESASFREKARKIIYLANSINSSNKWPRFGVLRNFLPKPWEKCLISRENTKTHWFGKKVELFDESLRLSVFTNFWAKSWETCLISWKNTKNDRINQNTQLFEETTMFRRYHEFFRKKVAKSVSFPEKTRKIFHLAKTVNLLNKVPCFGVCTNFSAKSWKKCLISW